MKLLQFKNAKNQKDISEKRQNMLNFNKELLNKYELSKVIGGTDDVGGDEDDDEIVEFIEWE